MEYLAERLSKQLVYHDFMLATMLMQWRGAIQHEHRSVRNVALARHVEYVGWAKDEYDDDAPPYAGKNPHTIQTLFLAVEDDPCDPSEVIHPLWVLNDVPIHRMAADLNQLRGYLLVDDSRVSRPARVKREGAPLRFYEEIFFVGLGFGL
jgi:hypothetical protein